MEEFNANTDCITGNDISIEKILSAAIREPFDGCDAEGASWSLHAALAVLKDLSWRNGIGPVLKDCDKHTRVALTVRVRAIIAAAKERENSMDAVADLTWKLKGSKAHVVDLNKQIDELEDEAVKNVDRAAELESEVSRLSLELQDEKSRRITLQQDYDDATADPASLYSAERRLTAAKAALLEIEADEKRGKISDLEERLAEAVSKADVADYCRETLAARCKELEGKLAVDGRVLGTDVQDAKPDGGKTFVDKLVDITRNAIKRGENSARATDAIIEELKGRFGIGNELESYDDDIIADIKESIHGIIEAEFRSNLAEESEAA